MFRHRGGRALTSLAIYEVLLIHALADDQESVFFYLRIIGLLGYFYTYICLSCYSYLCFVDVVFDLKRVLIFQFLQQGKVKLVY